MAMTQFYHGNNSTTGHGNIKFNMTMPDAAGLLPPWMLSTLAATSPSL
jgi:hypothetical protein